MTERMKLWGALCLFFVLSMTDLLMTYSLIHSDSAVYEGNPVAAEWLAKFGWAGLIALKVITCFVFIWICSFLASRNSKLAHVLATVGCLLVAAVILYSLLVSLAANSSGGSLQQVFSTLWAYSIPAFELGPSGDLRY
jgi:hypothetical protein